MKNSKKLTGLHPFKAVPIQPVDDSKQYRTSFVMVNSLADVTI